MRLGMARSRSQKARVSLFGTSYYEVRNVREFVIEMQDTMMSDPVLLPWQRGIIHADHLRDLPVNDASMTQLSAGAPAIASQRSDGQHATIVRMQVSAKAAGHVVPGRQWTGIFVPLSWKGDYVFNGWNASRSDVFIISSQYGCHAVGEDRDNLSCGLRTPILTRKIAALLGIASEELSLPDMRLALGPKEGTSFRRSLLWLLHASRGSGAAQGAMNAEVERMLYETVASLIAPHLPTSRTFCDKRTSSRAIVRAAMESVAASPRPVAISDLCGVVGVSRTKLFDSFSSEFSVSPAQFIRNMQLTDVRNFLANEEAPPRSVKDAMLKHGVLNGGRFAANYRRLFGENPSETLARTLKSRQGLSASKDRVTPR